MPFFVAYDNPNKAKANKVFFEIIFFQFKYYYIK